VATKASGARRAIYGVGRDRTLAVARIAEATVKIVKTAYDSGMIGYNDASCNLRVPELAISIDAPPFLRADNIARLQHLARVLHSDSITVAFGLNIWTPDKKVLNAEYYGSSVEFVSFRRGRWEDALLCAAERAPIPLAVQSRIPMKKSSTPERPEQFSIVITEEFWARLRNIRWFDPRF